MAFSLHVHGDKRIRATTFTTHRKPDIHDFGVERKIRHDLYDGLDTRLADDHRGVVLLTSQVAQAAVNAVETCTDIVEATSKSCEQNKSSRVPKGGDFDIELVGVLVRDIDDGLHGTFLGQNGHVLLLEIRSLKKKKKKVQMTCLTSKFVRRKANSPG